MKMPLKCKCGNTQEVDVKVNNLKETKDAVAWGMFTLPKGWVAYNDMLFCPECLESLERKHKMNKENEEEEND